MVDTSIYQRVFIHDKIGDHLLSSKPFENVENFKFCCICGKKFHQKRHENEYNFERRKTCCNKCSRDYKRIKQNEKYRQSKKEEKENG